MVVGDGGIYGFASEIDVLANSDGVHEDSCFISKNFSAWICMCDLLDA